MSHPTLHLSLFTHYVATPHKLYCEGFLPAEPTRPPMLLIHGGGSNGSTYRATPGGGPAWVDVLVSLGHPVYVADWPGKGRSGYQPVERLTYEFAAEGFQQLLRDLDQPLVVLTHSMSGPIGWRLLETLPEFVSMVVGIAPGGPANVQPVPQAGSADGDDDIAIVVDERDDVVLLRYHGLDFEVDLHQPYFELEGYMAKQAIGDSTQYPREHLAFVEASTGWIAPQMLLQRLNWRDRGLHVADDADFGGKPVLIVTGSADRNHSRHGDGATANFLAGHGARVEHLWLADAGHTGNGHMIMHETNGPAVAELISDRVTETVQVHP